MKKLNQARDQLLQSAPKDRPTTYLFVGNPGVGKSTILNGLMGKSSIMNNIVKPFKAGISFGQGLTYQLDERKVGDDTYVDTPGLADIKLRKQASAAITKALRKGGHFKLIFVITLEAGRLRPQDKTTIQLVLDSTPIQSYGLIINKLPKKMVNLLVNNQKKEDPSPREKLLHELWYGMAKPTPHMHTATKDDDLEGEENVVHDLPEDLSAFIKSLPTTMIEKENVRDIKDSEFEEMMQRVEKTLADLILDNDKLLQEMRKKDALVRRLQAQIEDLQKSRESGGSCLLM